jgi:hypothetical protein
MLFNLPSPVTGSSGSKALQYPPRRARILSESVPNDFFRIILEFQILTWHRITIRTCILQSKFVSHFHIPITEWIRSTKFGMAELVYHFLGNTRPLQSPSRVACRPKQSPSCVACGRSCRAGAGFVWFAADRPIGVCVIDRCVAARILIRGAVSAAAVQFWR